MDGDEDLWLGRPDVWAGAIAALVAATESFGPSLLPRNTRDQALVTGASAATGFAVGNAAYGLLARRGGGGDLPVLAAVASAGLVARRSVPRRRGEPVALGVLRSAGSVAAVGAGAALASALVRWTRRPWQVGTALGVAGTGAAALVISRDLRAQLAAREDVDPPAPRALPAVATSATVATALAAGVNGYRASGSAVARLLHRRLGLGRPAAAGVGVVVATGIWGAAGYAFADTFVRGMALYDRVLDPGYDQPPIGATRSGGPGSLVSFARSGRQGRRFLLDAPSADEIATSMGRRAVAEPVRVFIGFDAARSAQDRVALALSELERTGAYDRALLVVGSPAGTGYVNTVPFETCDHLLLGDSAGVAVQYDRLPSLLALQRAADGGRHHHLLLEGIRDALAVREPQRRPRVVVYGESLGAWAGQDAFGRAGLAAFDALGVARALWVGTPYYSGWRRATLGAASGVLGTSPPGVVRIRGIEDWRALEGVHRDGARAVLLAHENDPVPKLSARMLVARPDWLQDPRPEGVSAHQRYRPVLSGLQLMADAVNATNPTPGFFRATGHDYRLDLPAVTAAVFGLPDPGPEAWSRLMAALQAAEAERATRFHLARPDAAAPTASGGVLGPTLRFVGRARRRSPATHR